MTTAAIRQKLYEYIRVADDKKVKAIYTIVAGSDNETEEWWKDEKLMKELRKRNDDMESGKDKGIPWTEAKKQLLQRIKK